MSAVTYLAAAQAVAWPDRCPPHGRPTALQPSGSSDTGDPWRDGATADLPGLPLDLSIECRLADDRAQRYHLFVPATARVRGALAPLMVVVHGISRNAGAHLRAFAGAAQREGCVLVAPHFSRCRFPDYQRFGRPDRLGAGGRADAMLHRIVAEVSGRLSLAPTPILLFGHSGGAQFVQRYVMAYPSSVRRYVISAAGCFAWPDSMQRFPFGAGRSRGFSDLEPDVYGMLKVPGLVVVGQQDDQISPSLRTGPRVQDQQGASRLERAQRYVDLLDRLACQSGLPLPAQLALLAGCGHGFSQCLQQGDLVERAMAHLFDRSAAGSA
jgi:pimeloyl-ACP methyl ester carboxylesterase